MIEEREYMRIDCILRYVNATLQWHYIDLAVEHEQQEPSIDKLVGEEMQHLIDVKARNKIAIFYPNLGDEAELLRKIQDRIRNAQDRLDGDENYLIITGYATRKARKPAILLKGFFVKKDGLLDEKKEVVVLQRTT